MARKVGVFLLLTVFIFAFAADAEAARRTFGAISAEVPAGWTVEESEGQLTFLAPDSSAVLSIITGPLEGYTLAAVAESMSQELNGSAPEAMEGGIGFFFENESGVQCMVFVTGSEEAGFYAIAVQAGDHPQMQALVESVEVTE